MLHDTAMTEMTFLFAATIHTQRPDCMRMYPCMYHGLHELTRHSMLVPVCVYTRLSLKVCKAATETTSFCVCAGLSMQGAHCPVLAFLQTAPMLKSWHVPSSGWDAGGVGVMVQGN